MFELSVVGKYLMPRWRQLSVSIISLISIMVIALVVWLIVVFFSVTSGLEKSWIEKLIAMTAPVRVTPTEAYYRSYYYQIDSLSESSDYNLKNINEKLHSSLTDPYNASSDEEIPKNWAQPDLDEEGKLKDLVKLAFQSIDSLQGLPNLVAKDFEMTAGNLNLRLLRRIAPPSKLPSSSLNNINFSVLTQAAYLGSFDPANSTLSKTILPLTSQDWTNIFSMLGIASDNERENNADLILKTPKDILIARLKAFFTLVKIKELITPDSFWTLPRAMLPDHAKFQGLAVFSGNRLIQIILPSKRAEIGEIAKHWNHKNTSVQKIVLEVKDRQPYLLKNDHQSEALPKSISIKLTDGIALSAQVIDDSITDSEHPSDVVFNLKFDLQGIALQGKSSLGNLMISQVEAPFLNDSDAEFQPLWIHHIRDEQGKVKLKLPSDPFYGDGILLPRSFREGGAALGDRGYLAYATPTTSSVQEQRLPVFVAGFYEPGVIPIGGKYILVDQQVTTFVRSSSQQDTHPLSNGINIRFDDLNKANLVKSELQQAFKNAGIEPYWKIETFRDYEFTKDLIQQLRSEKNLFTLLATIIIIVACSNIISMLIILVNDKKLEIGIMRSMGASSFSIATIFGLCGMLMGLLGSVIGIGAAVITLKNLQLLINFLSKIQGFEMFNPLFFGDTLPTDLSLEALSFVILATTLISLIAGLVPAIKASLMKPSAILKSE
jgi:lipoprotein-releasing system permease protein